MSIGWQLQRVAGKLLHRQTKTDASDAVLPFPGNVTTALRARQRARDDWQETGLVFTTASGRPIEPSNFRRSFANACDKAKVRKVHVHATRKTCAPLLVALDVHPRVAMQILRHSQISVTMNVYSEVSSEETAQGSEEAWGSSGLVAVFFSCTRSKLGHLRVAGLITQDIQAVRDRLLRV